MTDFATINELFGSISENNFILSGTGWGIVIMYCLLYQGNILEGKKELKLIKRILSF